MNSLRTLKISLRFQVAALIAASPFLGRSTEAQTPSRRVKLERQRRASLIRAAEVLEVKGKESKELTQLS